jgi:hypothetical protein
MVPTLNFQIGAYVCPTDCKIHIQDNSQYPIDSVYPKTYYSVALFYTSDWFVSDFRMNLTEPSNYSWIETVNTLPLSGTVYIEAYWVRNWEHSLGWNQGDICQYNGNFYYVVAGGGVAPFAIPPDLNASWIIFDSNVSAAATYNFFTLALGGGNVWYDDVTVNKTCNNISLTQTSCLTYNVCNNTGSIQYFSITDVNGTLITNVTLDSNAIPQYDGNNVLIGYLIDSGDCSVATFTTAGVYILNYGSVITELDFGIVIFELCTYWDCYLSLIKQVLCDDFDPCCVQCDEATKRKHELFRFALNKMEALMFTLNQKVSYDALKYMNVIAVPEDRILLLEEINDIIGVLDDLIVRCGLCNGTQSSTTVVNPCRGCTGN